MLTIRPDQMRALRAARVSAFRDRLIRIAESRPALASCLRNGDPCVIFNEVLSAAGSRGFRAERSVATFFLLALRFRDGVFRDDLFGDCSPHHSEEQRMCVYLENLRDVLALHGRV